MKEQVNIRMDVTLKRAIDEQAKQNETNFTGLLERYAREGLARDRGEKADASTVPVLRAAMQEEMRSAFEHFSKHLSADLQQAARRSDNRLAALIVKAALSAGIGQRLMYTLLAKEVGEQTADKVFERAVALTAQELAARSTEAVVGKRPALEDEQEEA